MSELLEKARQDVINVSCGCDSTSLRSHCYSSTNTAPPPPAHPARLCVESPLFPSSRQIHSVRHLKIASYPKCRHEMELRKRRKLSCLGACVLMSGLCLALTRADLQYLLSGLGQGYPS